MNEGICSRRFALASISRNFSACVAMLAILMASGCVGLTGKGAGNSGTAAITMNLSPSSLSFGDLAVGQSTTKNVTITNGGTDILMISGISVAGTGFTASGPHLPIALSAGQTTTIATLFKPTTGEAASGAITITSNAADSPAQVALSGTGTTTSTLTASPTSIAFGSVNVGSEVTQAVKLTSSGTGSVKISGMTFSGSGVSVTGLSLPVTLSAGQSASATVTFKPLSAGALAGAISITSNATTPSMVIDLTATATSSTLTATPASVNFGSVIAGSDTTQTIRLSNAGTSQVTISSVTLSGTGISVQGINPPLTLAAGASSTFSAAYKPTAAGSLTGKITAVSNAVGSPTVIALSATAAAASVALTPSATTLSFGNVTVGSAGTKQVTVKSTGNVDAKISSVAITGTGFTLSGTNSSLTLDPNQSETYTVSFNPKNAGSPTGTLTITSNAPNSPLKIGLSGAAVTAATSASHTVALTWDRSVSTVTGYYVYRSSKPSGPYAKMDSTPDANTSFSDTTVAGGQVYYYVVTAVDSSNIESAFSNQVSVTIPTN